MVDEKKESLLKAVRTKLTLFFPESAEPLTSRIIEEGMADGEILAGARDILPYLQSAFFDDKILEVELDGMTRIYFSRLYDDLPDLVEDMVDGEVVLRDPDHTPGEYLKKTTHLICLPLEPGMGNIMIRHCQRVLLRLFTSTGAIEMGAAFQEPAVVRTLPVLRLSFPVIGRRVKWARAYRAKISEDSGFSLFIEANYKRPAMTFRPLDISFLGMSFAVTKEEQRMFRVDETCRVRLFKGETMKAQLCSNIRHVSKVRGHKGTEYICGIQFDLSSRSLASEIEAIVTTIQRNHLKELSEKSQEIGIPLIQ